MNPVRMLLPLLLSTTLAAQGDIPVPSAPRPTLAADLVIKYPPDLVELTIVGQPGAVYFGAIIVSLSSALEPLFDTGQLALTDFAVLATGFGDPLFTVSIPQSAVFPGILFHTQGLLLLDLGIQVTPVRSFVLDAGPPPAPSPVDAVGG